MADQPITQSSAIDHAAAAHPASDLANAFSPSQYPTTPAKGSGNRHSAPITPANMASTVTGRPLDITNLMSPPEPTPFDNFHQHGQSMTSTMKQLGPISEKQTSLPPAPPAPLSPPISPFAKPSSTVDSSPTIHVAVNDPILYPNSEVSSSPPRPLFSADDNNSIERQRLVDEHVAARQAVLFGEATPPEREDYELALYFKSEVMKKFMKNPRGWLRKEREQLLADRRANASHRIRTKLPLKPLAAASNGHKSVIRVAGPRVSKPVSTSSPATKTASTIRVKVPRPIRVNPQPRKSPGRNSATPEPRNRPVAPNREDKDFASLPDYCPPLSSLPNKHNSLKVDWKGNALDLSTDPFRHLLHPDELALAAGLRLDCATYLTSKRRIFIRRLECYRIGKEFRKTDAQQACKIDVNKASKLWTAYDKVGWLNKEWMRSFA